MSDEDILVVQENNRTVTISSEEEEILADQPSVAVVTQDLTQYIVEYSNGAPGPEGPTGPQGIPGPPGADGQDGADGTGGGIGVAPWTQSLSVTLAAGAGANYTITTGSLYYLYSVTTEEPGIRIRGYISSAKRAADAARSISTAPDYTLGLNFEAVSTIDDLDLFWTPACTAWSTDPDLSFIRIDNVSSVSVTSNVVFSFYGDSDLPIV